MASSTRSKPLGDEVRDNAHRSRTTRQPTTPERSTATESRSTRFQSTPVQASSHALQRPPTVARMKTALEAELTGGVADIVVPNDQIYPSFANAAIQGFIAGCTLYNKTTKTWTQVAAAEKLTMEKYLYDPLENIIKEILAKFKGNKGEQRWVVDTHNLRMSHIEGSQTVEELSPAGGKKEVTLKSSPDLSILGHGSHFSGSRARPIKVSYDHCLCPVEIKTLSNYNSKTILIQAGVYARQCFIHQPYRRYVPVVVIVGSELFLYIYDRSGVLRSGAIDIHASPDTFVRIILGVSTVGDNVQFSPFDPRVRHENTDIFIRFDNHDLNQIMKYKVTNTKFSRKAIRGRGTYCVTAQVEDGGNLVTVLIKEAWRTIDRMPEYNLRDEIKGLKGVGQILYYEDDEFTVADFRRHIFSAFCPTDPYDLDRRFCRLVLKAYGRSIVHFRTKLELLEAMHDALAGHKFLWQKGILHRDVSVDNILLGGPNAPEGYRGVLIDFDMAVKVVEDKKDEGDEPKPKTRFRTGTRAFQSFAVLKCGEWENPPPQDHLDDLESYLYCLGWICIKYGGTSRSTYHDILQKWEDEDTPNCANSKSGFLMDPISSLNSYFKTPVFRKLLEKLAGHCLTWSLTKSRGAQDENDPLSLYQVHQATSKGEDHDMFLKYFQDAIKAQKNEPQEAMRPAEPDRPYPLSQGDGEFSNRFVTADSPPSTHEIVRPTMKRPNASLDDQEERGSSSKRPRTRSTGQDSGQPKASGSKPKPQRGSGSRRVGK